MDNDEVASHPAEDMLKKAQQLCQPTADEWPSGTVTELFNAYTAKLRNSYAENKNVYEHVVLGPQVGYELVDPVPASIDGTRSVGNILLNPSVPPTAVVNTPMIQPSMGTQWAQPTSQSSWAQPNSQNIFGDSTTFQTTTNPSGFSQNDSALESLFRVGPAAI